MSQGPVEIRIHEKLTKEFAPTYLEVENESHSHNVPRGSETHFRVLVVAAVFEGLGRVARQRLVNELLKDELRPGGVHALAQRLMSPAEYAERGRPEVESPACLGGEKRQKS